jgi:putative membrane protein
MTPLLASGSSAVDLHHVVTAWASDTFSVVGYATELLAVLLYLAAARRRSPRGTRWPVQRTASFVLGVLLVAIAIQSGFADYDDSVLWVHVVQHLVLMMAAPPLLVFGAPVTLILRTLSPQRRRGFASVLQDPAMKIVDSRMAGAFVTVDYYGTMFVYLLTPLYRLSLEHPAVHYAVHVYFLICGLLFWLPLAGIDPTRWRPAYRTKLLVLALGVPAYLALSLTLLLGGAISRYNTVADTHLGGWALLAGGAVLSVAGLAVVASHRRALERRRSRVAGERLASSAHAA